MTALHLRLALDFLGYAVLLTAVYLLLVRLWARPAMAARLTVALTVICIGAGIAFIVAIGLTWVDFWTRLQALRLPPLRLTSEGLWMGTPNALAAFQALLLAAVFPGLVVLGRWGRRLAAALVVLVIVDVLLSASRGAWLGLGLAVVVTGAAWLSIPSGRGRYEAFAGRCRLAGGPCRSSASRS